MVTTLYLFMLFGFQLWYLTSKKSMIVNPPAYLNSILQDKKLARSIGAGLILLSAILFIVRLGVASGLFAAIVGLMAIGCLVVLLRPYRHINATVIVMLYGLFVILEFVI